MTPHAYANQSDSESLQADVMRFMAIIAFCLIAILALVRHAEPTTAETSAARAPEPVATAPVAPVQPEPVPATPAPSTWREPLPKAEPMTAAPARTPRPAAKPQRLEAQAVAAAPRKPRAQAAEPAPAVEVAAAEEATVAAAATEEEGLSLRFASDGDFLRLIARGDIRVYAFREADVLTLTSAYDFLSARSPGQLHELMPQTIPSIIVEALVNSRRERGDSDSFSWGITLPAAIQQQISGHLATVASGQLVIDRYGDVHHVAGR